MSWKLARPRLGLRAGLLLLVLAGLLAYAFIPIPHGNTADPLSRQLGALRTGSVRRSAVPPQLNSPDWPARTPRAWYLP